MIKNVKSDPFSIYGSLRVKVEYCFECEKWHAINEFCSTKDNELEDNNDTLEEVIE